MTLAQLRYAITVANSNSMNEAARNLFISQPSLSSAIRELDSVPPQRIILFLHPKAKEFP